MERFGMDLEDLYEQIQADEKLKQKYGITSDFGEAVGKLAAGAKPAGDETEDEIAGGNINVQEN
jgi:hypothetical protein